MRSAAINKSCVQRSPRALQPLTRSMGCALVCLALGLPAFAQSTSRAVLENGLPYGVIGNTLCLNADGPEGRPTYSLIEAVFNAGAVEAPSDTVYQPARPHIIEKNDPIVGAFFSFLAISPTDVNLDGKSIKDGGDRSRTEIKIAPSNGLADPFKATDGDTLVYQWRMRINASMHFSPAFTHLHQIKAKDGNFAEPPLITFTAIQNDRLAVRHVAGDVTESDGFRVLGEMDLSGLKDQWLHVHQVIKFGEKGSYTLRISNMAQKTLLEIDRPLINNARTGASHFRPKWGIYRKHHPALAQHQSDWFDVANIAITRGSDAPSSNCL